jgi:hypothetical protein
MPVTDGLLGATLLPVIKEHYQNHYLREISQIARLYAIMLLAKKLRINHSST